MSASSLQQIMKASEEEEKLNIKELITTNSLDAAAAEVSANRRNSSSSSYINPSNTTVSEPVTNPYYVSQQSQITSSNNRSGSRLPSTYSASRGGGPGRSSSYTTRGGRGGRSRGRGRGRGSGVPECKFFRQGRCAAGELCKFRHTQEGAREGAYKSAYYSSQYDNYSAPSYSAISGTGSSSKCITIGIDAKTGASMEDDRTMYQMPNSYGGVNAPEHSNMYGTNTTRTRRPFCPAKAAAIQKAKDLQDAEDRPYETIEGPFFSIDVECVAVGYGHSTLDKDRIPGRIAMVDDKGNTVLDEIVKFEENEVKVVSYLTPLTGLTKSLCTKESNKTFEEIVALVKENLPKDGVLVGQSIHHDIKWLGLEQGTDFRDFVDIGVILRQRVPLNLNQIAPPQDQQSDQTDENEQNGDDIDEDYETPNEISDQDSNNPNSSNEDDELATRYRIFSLRHACLYLLGVDVQTSFHDPVIDAKYSIELFNKYRAQPIEALRAARDSLHRAPVTPSVASVTPVIDGVCLTKQGYKYKHAARFIWKWWTSLYGGVFKLTPKTIKDKQMQESGSA